MACGGQQKVTVLRMAVVMGRSLVDSFPSGVVAVLLESQLHMEAEYQELSRVSKRGVMNRRHLPFTLETKPHQRITSLFSTWMNLINVVVSV